MVDSNRSESAGIYNCRFWRLIITSYGATVHIWNAAFGSLRSQHKHIGELREWRRSRTRTWKKPQVRPRRCGIGNQPSGERLDRLSSNQAGRIVYLALRRVWALCLSAPCISLGRVCAIKLVRTEVPGFLEPVGISGGQDGVLPCDILLPARSDSVDCLGYAAN